jgi:hypothetical protein
MRCVVSASDACRASARYFMIFISSLNPVVFCSHARNPVVLMDTTDTRNCSPKYLEHFECTIADPLRRYSSNKTSRIFLRFAIYREPEV